MNTRSRFSFLLLDEGEYYFDDFGAFRHPSPPAALASSGGTAGQIGALPIPVRYDLVSSAPSSASGSPSSAPPASSLSGSEWNAQVIKGRLKLCSNSFFFDPDDVGLPIVRFPFAGVVSVGPVAKSRVSKLISRTDLFEVVADGAVLMKANAQNSPYEFVRSRTRHIFSLQFEPLDIFLPRLEALVTLAQREPFETREAVLANLIHRREEQVRFDVVWIENLSERTLLEVPARRITPLVAMPGRLMLTNERLYFQPMNNTEAAPVYKVAVRSVRQLQKRRHLLRHLGLEVTAAEELEPGVGDRSLLLAFRSVAERNAVHQQLVTLLGPERAPPPDAQLIQEKMAAWARGDMSNFDYLMFLNSMAGRTFHDLTQYPVMPFVVADFTSRVLDLSRPETFRDLSKPIGALNPTRLRSFKDRFEQMPEPRFLYGSHYSTPGYVLYYLVRKYPEYTLRLQNGKFDAPDRMFYSMAQCWHNVLHNSSDVKELIPEFYDGDGDFLVNSQHLDFGYLTSGDPIDNVVLPPWARSPYDFVSKMRQALECEHVSRNLHHWIDLIFGYRQRGEEAVRADNLFYYLTYEGAVDIETVADPVERRSLEAQISEFGQTPRQLFLDPHPAKFSEPPAGAVPPQSPRRPPTPVGFLGAAEIDMLAATIDSFDFLPDSSATTVAPSPARISNMRIQSLDADNSAIASGPVAAVAAPMSPSTAARRSAASDAPAAAEAGGAPARPPTLWWPQIAGAEEVLLFDQRVHKDLVSGVFYNASENALCTVSQDGLLKIFSLTDGRQLRSFAPSTLALSCGALSGDGKLVYCGSWDNGLYVYSYTSGRIVSHAQGHYDAVSGLVLHEASSQLVTCSWDTTVKLWAMEPSGVSRVPLADIGQGSCEARCAAISPSGNLAAVGFQDGGVMIFDVRSRRCVRSLRDSKESVHALAFSTDEVRLLSCGADGAVRQHDAAAAQTAVLHKRTAPLYAMRTDERQALVGDREGTLFDLLLSEQLVCASWSGAAAAVTSLDVVLTPGVAESAIVAAGFGDGLVRVWRTKQP